MLKADVNSTRENPLFLDKVGVEIVKKLYNNSPLSGRIFMGFGDQNKAESIVTLATIVRAMKQNKFIGPDSLFQERVEDINRPYEFIRRLFVTMREVNFPFFIDSTDKFFLSNQGLRILFRFVYLYYRNFNSDKITFDLRSV